MKSILLTLLLSSFTTASLASDKSELPVEQKRGLISGFVIGAGFGGPVGAGIGALLGSNVVGKYFAVNRSNRELKQELSTLNSQYDSEREQFASNTKLLNKDLDKLIELQSGLRQQESPIQFRTNSSEIEGHYFDHLKKIARILSRNADARIVLSGFADRRGDEKTNQMLSEARVANVQHFLVSQGATENQIVTTAYGESKPLLEEESIEANFFDRRVVMEISFNFDSQLATR